jgi:hypothetical protein
MLWDHMVAQLRSPMCVILCSKEGNDNSVIFLWFGGYSGTDVVTFLNGAHCFCQEISAN